MGRRSRRFRKPICPPRRRLPQLRHRDLWRAASDVSLNVATETDVSQASPDENVSDHPSPPAPQWPVELILLRQLASYLDTPVFLIDARGNLIYFNDSAEPLLGLRFDDVGELSMADWLATFQPGDEAGHELAPDVVPLVLALREERAVHAPLTIAGVDGVRRAIQATSLPLRGQGGRLLGAIALFWPSE